MSSHEIPSPVHLEIDLDLDGWHQGYARVPHSVHRSAYGFIPLPIVSIKNGSGPIALLMAGNHGDEYEGQVALNNLARSLKPEEIHGQIIVLPMANFPAAQAGLRTSPIDDGNLNRTFPGNARGTPTEVIAHFIEHTLLARADHLLDIHSGGSSLFYNPTAMSGKSDDPEVQASSVALLAAIAMPKSILYSRDLRAGYSSSAAARQGATAVTLEIGGAGRISARALPQLEAGIPRYLCHVGIVDQPADNHNEPGKLTRFFEMPSADYYLHARQAGLFQPEARIDQEIQPGDLAGWLHHPEDVQRPPDKITFLRAGTVMCKRIPAKVEPGDCLYETAEEID